MINFPFDRRYELPILAPADGRYAAAECGLSNLWRENPNEAAKS